MSLILQQHDNLLSCCQIQVGDLCGGFQQTPNAVCGTYTIIQSRLQQNIQTVITRGQEAHGAGAM